jgi:O-succinylbenzoate synthase
VNHSALNALLAENTWLLLPFHLPLRNRLTTEKESDAFRNGLLLVWQSNVGIVYGEIAPLPGLHLESIEDAKLLAQTYFPYLIEELEFSHKSWLEFNYPEALAPSVKFGFEMLAFHYQILKQQTSIAEFLKPCPTSPISLNGLLDCSLDRVTAEIKRCKEAGYKTIKLKVGREKPLEDIRRIHLVREQWADVEFRVDANQAWTLAEAKEVLCAVEDCNLAYCEEPLQNPQEFLQLKEFCSVRLALDETLWRDPELVTLIQESLHAFILKPGILGGWQETVRWINRARTSRILPVLSSSFESGIGSLWIAMLASSYVPEAPAVGLDTAFWFEKDLLDPPFTSRIQNGYIKIPKNWPKIYELNLNVLQMS